MDSDVTLLFDQAASGNRRALARLLSTAERGGDAARDVGRFAFAHAGRAYRVGITGAPGAGKSTLTDRIVELVRASGQVIAVLAVDPTSPFTGGALLGDRVRMTRHALDDGVFIRSMATRGHPGGLALASPEAMRVLDAVGFPWVIVETVGVGQIEIDVARATDTTIVVVNPGWGDAVQANKAGLLEIADVLVVNKADRPGAQETVADLENMLQLSDQSKGWRPPIVLASATEGTGIDEIWRSVARHREHQLQQGGFATRRADQLRSEVRSYVHALVDERLAEQLFGAGPLGSGRQPGPGLAYPVDVATSLMQRWMGESGPDTAAGHERPLGGP